MEKKMIKAPTDVAKSESKTFGKKKTWMIYEAKNIA